MQIPNNILEQIKPDNCIFLGYRGSITHGTWESSDNPNSIDDIDLLGIYINPVEHYLGFGRKEVYEKWINQYDCVFYELRKYINLLLKSNPNVLMTLWLPDKFIIHKEPSFDELRKNRELFVSKEIYNSFAGYAKDQFRRMTHYNQEAQQDVRNRRLLLEDSGIEFENDVPKLPAGASKELIDRVKQYEQLRKKYFQGWMGQKRKVLVEKLGFDAKNASHCIRLLRQCIEFLKIGEFIIERPDAQELLDIKHGKWSLDQIKNEAENLFRIADEEYKRCKFPDQPDQNKIEALCVDLLTHEIDFKHD